jgi:hypothetical protein
LTSSRLASRTETRSSLSSMGGLREYRVNVFLGVVAGEVIGGEAVLSRGLVGIEESEAKIEED